MLMLNDVVDVVDVVEWLDIVVISSNIHKVLLPPTIPCNGTKYGIHLTINIIDNNNIINNMINIIIYIYNTMQ